MSKSSEELTIVNLPPGGELPSHVVAAFARLALHLSECSVVHSATEQAEIASDKDQSE